MARGLWALVLISSVVGCASNPVAEENPFVSIQDLDPSIVVEARYLGHHNFLGRPVKGYLANKCFLTKEAAAALVAVQAELKRQNKSLKVYDCYRPQRAVNDFVEWSKDPADQKTKAEFYPRVDKKDVFKLGFVAEKSGHSRGSTVDLTIIPLPAPKQPEYKPGQKLADCALSAKKRFKDNSLDMGTGYDCFDPLAATANPKISVQAKKNRQLLKSLMEKHGFTNYEQEWWHYTLANEPHKDTYFDVEVR